MEIPAGTALIFNGYLLHRSLENSGRHGYRRALANHYMSAESLLPWSPPGPDEHMAIADFRDIVLVAGEDPYAYKGTVERAHARTRAPTRTAAATADPPPARQRCTDLGGGQSSPVTDGGPGQGRHRLQAPRCR